MPSTGKSFTFHSSSSEDVVVSFDPSAVSVTAGEPAWSFRLWSSSIALSRFFEKVFSSSSLSPTPSELIADSTSDSQLGLSDSFLRPSGIVAIELGCGTGLTSLVLSKCCRLRRVYATDLQHAMPLLVHNINENMKSCASKMEKENEAITSSSLLTAIDKEQLRCPAQHILAPVFVDCEGFMCDVCDFDVDEGSTIRRCVQCNFDICAKCLNKVEDGAFDSLPKWFQLHAQNLVCNRDRDCCPPAPAEMEEKIIPFPYDWNDKSNLDDLARHVVQECEGLNKMIVAADVTYNKISIDSFFEATLELTSSLRQLGSSEDAVELVFAHHNRSAETNEYMLESLRSTFNNKVRNVDFQWDGKEDSITGEDNVSKKENDGQIQIFVVDL